MTFINFQESAHTAFVYLNKFYVSVEIMRNVIARWLRSNVKFRFIESI